MLYKIVEETRRKKHIEHMPMIVLIIGIMTVYIIGTFITTPFLAWYDSEETKIETSYYSQRYFLMAVYIIMNIVISVTPLVNNFMFFLSDGLILSQLASLYLFNEFSMCAMLTALPVLFVV